jgi:hypothetical protein
MKDLIDMIMRGFPVFILLLFIGLILSLCMIAYVIKVGAVV